MNDPIDRECAAEADLYQEHLLQVRQMEDTQADSALAAEKRRHLWAILGIWQRYRPSHTNGHARLSVG